MSRSRRRGGSGPVRLLAVVLVALFVVASGLGTAAFTTGSLDRASDVDVAADTDGVYGIDLSSAVHTNSTERLVTLTNRLDRDVTVTITLDSASTDRGDLVVGGVNEGNQTSFTLASGNSQRIDVAVPDDDSLVGTTIVFHAEASADGLYVSAENRTVPIE